MSDIVNKYQSIVKDYNPLIQEDYAKVLDMCVIYLNKNSEISIDFKVAAIYVVKELYFSKVSISFDLKTIEPTIDDFIKLYNNDNYIKSFALISNKFEADKSFYDLFIKKHLQ